MLPRPLVQFCSAPLVHFHTALDTWILRTTMTVNNSLFVIAPYWDSGTWVFDDERVGLVREPFVLGVPDMIDHLVRDIPDAR